MPTIGKSTDGTVSSSFFVRSQGTISPAFFYTAIAGDAVTQFHWRGSTNLAGNVTITCGIYTVTAGLPDVLIGAVATILVTSALIQDWNSAAINIPLNPGVQYCVAWSPDVQYLCRRLNEGFPGLSQNVSVPLPAVWTHFSSTNITWTMWADVFNVPIAPSIIYPCCAQLIT